MQKESSAGMPGELFFLVTQPQLWMYSLVLGELDKLHVPYQVIAMPNLEHKHLNNLASVEENRRLLRENGVESQSGVDTKGRVLSPLAFKRGSIFVVDQPNLEIGKAWHPILTTRRFRLAYSAYGIKVSPLDSWNFRQIIHRRGWVIFAESDWHLSQLERHNPSRKGTYLLSGSPKIELMRKAHKAKLKETGVVWAPHWSIGRGNRLRYGSFDLVFDEMLAVAEEFSDIPFTLRPHQRLDSELRSLRKEPLQKFLDKWMELPNTKFSGESGYQRTLAESSLLITDSESFIAEYSSIGKPLILLRREDSAGYNEFGDLLMQGQFSLKISQDNLGVGNLRSDIQRLIEDCLETEVSHPSLFPDLPSSREIANFLAAGTKHKKN